MRQVRKGNRMVPWYDGGPAYQPYAGGYYGGWALNGLFPAFVLGSMMGGWGDGNGSYADGFADGQSEGGDWGGDSGDAGSGDSGGDWAATPAVTGVAMSAAATAAAATSGTSAASDREPRGSDPVEPAGSLGDRPAHRRIDGERLGELVGGQ